ncbi:hypothetical protein [Halobacillus sp. B29]|uniref:hypothetical protein n=1 Tax=Halobacillus sp. B29 TaxID=3457432 RepID=UPI003FCE44FB
MKTQFRDIGGAEGPPRDDFAFRPYTTQGRSTLPQDVAILVELPTSSPYDADQGASAFNLGSLVVSSVTSAISCERTLAVEKCGKFISSKMLL